MASASEVSRYRTGVANLLKKQVEVVSETERRLDIAVDGGVASWRADLEGDPTGSLRIMTALLLRKAKLHMIAMLRANERNNVCTAPGSLDTHLCYAAWRSSYSSRASIGV